MENGGGKKRGRNSTHVGCGATSKKEDPFGIMVSKTSSFCVIFPFELLNSLPTRTHFEVTLTALFTELLSITCCTNCTPVFVLCWVMMFILMTLHALDKSSASKISFSVAGE